MNKDILILGGVGLLVWWYFSQQPAAAATTTTTTSGGTTTPTTGGTTAGTAGTTGSGATVPTQTTQPGNVPTTPVAVVPFPTTYAALQSAISKVVGVDPAVTAAGATPYVLSYYLQNVAVPSLASVNLPLGTIFSGVDLTQPMTVATFWAGVGPWLVSNAPTGLSGMGAMPARVFVRRRNAFAA